MWRALYDRKLRALLIFTLTLLVPNVATIVGGFHGFFLTYLAWSALIVVSIPLLLRSGRGSISVANSVFLAVVLVFGLSTLGFLLGFDIRRYPTDPTSLAVSIALFLVNTLGIEVGRSAAMSLAKHAPTRVALGTLAGIALGSTFPALLRYFSGVYGRPLTLAADFMYSLTLSIVHEYGGLVSGLLFRVVVDGYWRFSPLVLTSAAPPVLRNAVLALAYYAVLILVLYSTRGLRGRSRELLEFSRLKKVLRVLPESILVSLALLFLALALLRYIPLVVTSGSMSPTISVGDLVIVHAVGGYNVEVGDIIAYAMEGRQVVVHRVIATGSDWVRTKGDANPDPDPFLVSYRDILGKVVFIVPRVGYLAIVFQTGGWVAYSSIAMVLAVVLSVAYVSRRTRSRKLKFSLIK
ncbi:MAG: signal peptidase I [Sulfolobales archaeon]